MSCQGRLSIVIFQNLKAGSEFVRCRDNGDMRCSLRAFYSVRWLFPCAHTVQYNRAVKLDSLGDRDTCRYTCVDLKTPSLVAYAKNNREQGDISTMTICIYIWRCKIHERISQQRFKHWWYVVYCRNHADNNCVAFTMGVRPFVNTGSDSRCCSQWTRMIFFHYLRHLPCERYQKGFLFTH